MAAFRLCEKHQDPSLTIRNRAPKGRNAIFTEGQVVRLVKRGMAYESQGFGLHYGVGLGHGIFAG